MRELSLKTFFPNINVVKDYITFFYCNDFSLACIVTEEAIPLENTCILCEHYKNCVVYSKDFVEWSLDKSECETCGRKLDEYFLYLLYIFKDNLLKHVSLYCCDCKKELDCHYID